MAGSSIEVFVPWAWAHRICSADSRRSFLLELLTDCQPIPPLPPPLTFSVFIVARGHSTMPRPVWPLSDTLCGRGKLWYRCIRSVPLKGVSHEAQAGIFIFAHRHFGNLW